MVRRWTILGAAWLACGITVAAQPVDRDALEQEISTLADDINSFGDQLFQFDVQARQLRSDLEDERQQAANSFMAATRLALSPRPNLLINPHKTIEAARAEAILANIRPDLTLKGSGALEPLGRLRDLEELRASTFDQLTNTEEHYDSLSVALARLEANGALDQPVTGLAEGTYLTSSDQGLDDNVPPPVAPPTNPLEAFQRPIDLRDMEPSDQFVLPILEGQIVSNFDNAGISLQFSQGLVIESSALTPRASNDQTGPVQVLAPFDGQVIFAEFLRGYGDTVILRHNDNLVSIVVGEGDVSVKLGQWLYQGDPLGLISINLGQAPRIFWQVRQGSRLLDPETRLR